MSIVNLLSTSQGRWAAFRTSRKHEHFTKVKLEALSLGLYPKTKNTERSLDRQSETGGYLVSTSMKIPNKTIPGMR